MTRRRIWVGGALIGLLVVGATVAVLRRSEAAPRLADAMLLADGGDADLHLMRDQYEGGASLDDLPLADLWRLDRGATNDFWAFAPRDNALVRAGPTGVVIDVGLNPPLGSPIAIGPEGQTLRAYRPENSRTSGGADVLVFEFHMSSERFYEARFGVGALAAAENDTVLVGSRDDATIDLLTEGDAATRLLGPPEDPEARVHWDEPLGPVVALLQLPDDRVVFVADTDDGEHLYLLDNSEVRPVDTGTVSPVASVAETERRSDNAEILTITTPLSLAPGGRVLTIGLAEEGHPVISAVDVDSGDVEVVADLEGVDPSVEQPVSAVAVADDLIFLAQDRLWIKENVFA